MTDPRPDGTLATVLRVIAPGSPVFLDGGGIKGTVVAVAVRDGPHINYQVVWWEGLTRHEEWVYAAEVTPGEGAQEQRLGF